MGAVPSHNLGTTQSSSLQLSRSQFRHDFDLGRLRKHIEGPQGKKTGSNLNSLTDPFERLLSATLKYFSHCAAIALCRPTGGGSQRETKKQANPIATKSSSKATKMSLTCNAATKRRRIS